ncbi:hypothetical protein [Adhaeretor mobilis]|uniref:Uncharacterized protein n=1 Tax=Adhaeretor mobilis TaxID=1930276 RepID=A0A517MSP7_9BACT|nr:hypothetical protein [Adhaeretor mobilis]QDS97889.1 hypothetical protein HG15A2_11570 [Adhaeretor mobilis]
MQNRSLSTALLLASFCCLSLSTPKAEAAPLWKQLLPQKRVAAATDGDYALKQQNGPWLILASSFSGPEGEQQAHDLVLELRSNYNLPAFYYGKTFKQEDDPGRGLDHYGAPIRRRYNRGDAVIEHAVLVGEFTSINDPDAQELLARIKTLRPKTLSGDGTDTSHQSLGDFRQKLAENLHMTQAKPTTKGPMGHAFLVRNLLLPKEYFVPKGVDESVARWNEGVKHSLLDCPGQYSIKVATFRGRTSLEDVDKVDTKKTRKASEDDPLVTGAEKAQKLTIALRSRGWEAYEFHDRYESYVTVGSFDKMHRTADGRLAPATPDAKTIVDTFGAATPNNLFNRPAHEDIVKEQRVKQQFARQFSNGQVANGFHPKRFIGLPFDIQPQPVEVPKRAGISSAYARR